MKDYYYILGVTQSTSTDEIKKAYRKLSLKFHPDKNDGDEFFTERFKEIQEAYEILSNPTKKHAYDSKKNNNSSKSQGSSNDYGTNFTPEIEYFKSNKTTFEYDEEITFSWKTINSNKVILKPFGQVPTIGEKTYKIKDFKNSSLLFELYAENTTIERKIKTSLTLKNKTFQELYDFFKAKILEETSNNKNNFQSNNKEESYNYEIISERAKFDIAWGQYTTYRIKFNDNIEGEIYKGGVSGEYFYMNLEYGKTYFYNFEDTVKELYLYLHRKS